MQHTRFFCSALVRAVGFFVSLFSLSSGQVFAEEQKKNLVFLGDSLTAGLGLAAPQSYPSLVAEKIRSEKLAWNVVNAGVSGDTTAGGVSRLNWIFKKKVDILFVCLGANDGLRGVPPPQIEKNLTTILERAKRENTKVLLAGIQLPFNYGNTYRDAFVAVFPHVAKKFRVSLLPFLLDGVAFNDSLNQPDRIHPNAAGAKIVAEHVWKFIEPHLR